jgi:hypothetical protein
MGFPITLDEIEAAYRETGLGPMVDDWLYCDEGGQPVHSCPLATLCLRRLGGVKAGIVPLTMIVGVLDWEEAVAGLLGLTRVQVAHFLWGLQGCSAELAHDRAAFEFGAAVRARLFQPAEV